MPVSERRLWKRIWWCLYVSFADHGCLTSSSNYVQVRDHFDSASVGRPMQIHDDDCDIEPLEIDDFAEEGIPVVADVRICALHAVEMSKLAVLSEIQRLDKDLC